MMYIWHFFFFFFFQAEDGIRDATVTGVQTCALPISLACRAGPGRVRVQPPDRRDRADRRAAGGDRPRPAAGRDLGRRAGRPVRLARGRVHGADLRDRRAPGGAGRLSDVEGVMTAAAVSHVPGGRYRFSQVARMEWIKLRSLRSTGLTLLVTVAGTVGIGIAVLGSYRPEHFTQMSAAKRAEFDPTNMGLSGTLVAMLAMGILGV